MIEMLGQIDLEYDITKPFGAVLMGAMKLRRAEQQHVSGAEKIIVVLGLNAEMPLRYRKKLHLFMIVPWPRFRDAEIGGADLNLPYF